MDDSQLEQVVLQAQAGDPRALEEVVRAVQDDIFDLALRMLGDATDARDASQEVLVRVVTKLGSFQGDSKFRTWVYRVAANALLNFRGEMRRRELSFVEAEEQLAAAVDADAGAHASAADLALVNEVKLVCAHGMLLCLDRPHRLAYVLGEVLEFTSEDGAAVLEISPVAFRKRLSRARSEMEAFITKNCGIADPANACRCTKLLPLAQRAGIVNPKWLVFKTLPTRETDRLQLQVEAVRTAAEIFRALPRYASPNDYAASLRELLDGNAMGPLLADDEATN